MNPHFVESLQEQIKTIIETSKKEGIYYGGGKPSARSIQQLLTMCEAVIARLGSLDRTHTKNAQQVLNSDWADTYILDRLLGIIQSLEISVNNSYLENAEELIHGEVFEDFVEMADQYNLWIGTERGINVLNTESGTINFYGYDDGFRPLETNESAIARGTGGELWIGTIGGLVHYNPRYDLKNTVPPDLILFAAPHRCFPWRRGCWTAAEIGCGPCCTRHPP